MATEISLTEQLQRFSGGEREIAEEVLRTVLPKLHDIAVRQLHQERYMAPVSPTELIHEVWLRNLHKGGWQIKNREHFYAIAALAMRRVLVDLARGRLALSRGAGETPASLTDIDTGSHPSAVGPEQIVEIGLLMDQLEKKDPVAARIVDMHYFAGFTLEEIAEITGLPTKHVRYRWTKGMNWLKDRFGG
jgi:RNA polymerase sigma factor (TIGR02999 family)